MSRIAGRERPGGLKMRVVYFLVNKLLGRVITPVKVHARHPKIFNGYAEMERAQQAARRVATRIKALASLRAATLIGCPF